MNKDFAWFQKHYTEFQKEYGKSYIVIKNQKVIGVYNNYAEAVKKTSITEELGTFIVQECDPCCEAYHCCIASMNFS